MADQPPADDGLLPEPGPDETLRVMREGGTSRQPWWQRLLPPWVCSFGLHLFLLPFVLIVTVTFSDTLFAPAVVNDYQPQRVTEPHYNMVLERDLTTEPAEQSIPVGPVTVPVTLTSKTSAAKMPAVTVKATATTQAVIRPPPETKMERPVMRPLVNKITGIVVAVAGNRLTVQLSDGTQQDYFCDDETEFARHGPSFRAAIPPPPRQPGDIQVNSPVMISSVNHEGRNLALGVSIGPPASTPAEPRPNPVPTKGETKDAEQIPESPALATLPPKEVEIRGTVLAGDGQRITVQCSDGKQHTFRRDDNTFVFRDGDSRRYALMGGFLILGPGTPVRIQCLPAGQEYLARSVFMGEAPAPSSQPLRGANSNPGSAVTTQSSPPVPNLSAELRTALTRLILKRVESVQPVAIAIPANPDLIIYIFVRNQVAGEKVAALIREMPELHPYKVSLEVCLVPVK